jgi:outer membrane immunogenic protein
MKKAFVSTIVASALVAGSALAADLPSKKAPPYIPPPPPPLWTGFYVGLNAGGTWANQNSFDVVSAPSTPAVAAIGLAGLATGVIPVGNSGGFIGGGQIGYNFQFANSFVAGVEADIQGVAGSNGDSGAGLTTAGAFSGGTAVSFTTATRRLDYLGTVRGRIGYLFTPTLLLYGTGGLAYGGVNAAFNVAQVGVAGNAVGFAGFGGSSFSDTRAGWTAGGGVEWMFMPNWSAKVEYLYYDLGSVTQSAALVAVAPPIAYATSQASTRFNGHIVRAGVNYHFNWFTPAPVVAKY